MTTVNMLDAKTRLSQLVDQVESGAEKEIIIARNGRPAARLVPLGKAEKPKVRLGLAFDGSPAMSLEEFDKHNEYIGRLFRGEEE